MVPGCWLSLRRTVLGDNHPDIAQSLNNLGFLLQAIGDYNAARLYFEQALAICEKRLGTYHPTTRTILGNLASLQEQSESQNQQPNNSWWRRLFGKGSAE